MIALLREPNKPVDPEAAAREILREAGSFGALKRVPILPPDYTRYSSCAGPITCALYQLLWEGGAAVEILPAVGTHFPMGGGELDAMYPGIPHGVFLPHDWRNDTVKLGEVPRELVREAFEGVAEDTVEVEINRRLLDPAWYAVISVGQVVPHEVAGMANHAKNVFVGCGGHSMINKTHYLSAVYGMERIMGRAEAPVRKLFDYASEQFLKEVPLLYALTVTSWTETGGTSLDGVFIGRERECFVRAARLSEERNTIRVPKRLQKAVCYLDPHKYKSMWLANKAIYRTRMAIADGGELTVIAPGVGQCGEDAVNDRAIRQFGYLGSEAVRREVEERRNPLLAENLSVAAHLIHGSPEGRFTVTYVTDRMARKEVESLGFRHLPVDEARKRWDWERLRQGMQTTPGGEEVYFIHNPALGLWKAE